MLCRVHVYPIDFCILIISCYSVKPQSHDVPKPDGHIRMVCISDTHNRTNNLKLPEGDILVHAGDFSNVGLEGDIYRFTEFLSNQHHKYKVRVTDTHNFKILSWYKIRI